MSETVTAVAAAAGVYLRVAGSGDDAVLAAAAAAACGAAAAFLGAALPAAWTDVPAPVAQGLVLLTAYLVEHRDDDGPPPPAVTALWRPFRALRLVREPAA